MKRLSIPERVDILLREGVDSPKKWATVHGYKEPTSSVDSWEDEWKRLREHHLEETNFLFEMLGEMAQRLNFNAPKVGDEVSIPWFEGISSKRVRNLKGTITAINGAYHSIKIRDNSKYDVIELYESEFKVVKNVKKELRIRNSVKKW